MATKTEYLKLTMPGLNDVADISVLNKNTLNIDGELQKNAERTLYIPQAGDVEVEQNLVFFSNPTGSTKRIVVYIYSVPESNVKDSLIDVDVPAHQTVPLLIDRGHFGLYNSAEDKKRSASITMNRYVDNVYHYYVDKCGVISVDSNYLCLTGDTLVTMADGTEKRLDEIDVGDLVLSIDWANMENVPNKVIYTDKNDAKEWTEYDLWTFADGTKVKTVHAHEFYNVEKQGMAYMHDWAIGEHAVNLEGEHVELVSHETIKETVRHYKITLENGTNYFANGLLTGDRYCPKNIKL